MCRCASLTAMRRISWIDQRMRLGGFGLQLASFFWCHLTCLHHLVCLMANGSHHGEGKHDERDVAMPAVPGARSIVIETEFVS
jgi:hypothetical protein